MRWSQITEVGLVRADNEDSLLICSDIGLFVVADGMGGHQAGEVASREALKYLEKQVRLILAQTNKWEQVMLDAMQKTNEHIYAMANQEIKWRGMGTTVTACLLQDPESKKSGLNHSQGSGEVLVAHVGDSRAYVIRDDTIIQVTNDHSLVGELVKNGSITEELAHIHPKRNVLTQAIGVFPSVDVDLYKVPLYPGDRLLLCTDGLTNHLQRGEINKIVYSVKTPDEAVKKLANSALEQGGTDNVSVILIEV